MKKIFIIIALFFFCMPGIASSQTANHKKHAQVKATATDVSEKNKNTTTSNYAININGPQNSVTIKTDSLALQTTESITNKAKDNNSIEINGEGNSVSVNQESKGEVMVKQNGNNNSVKILQSSSQP